MKIDVAAVWKTLKSFDFKTLFYKHLGSDILISNHGLERL